ncbi:MAG: ribonuclease III [Thermodesulfovibrionales bacterium]|nr:ribonuclease III [Thermodesulfovibrionales bacterium]
MSDPGVGLSSLERAIGYTFSRPELIIEALTHKSYYYENRGKSRAHNERLEFLGDSVLGLSVASYLFRHEDSMDEAIMSKVRSYIVKGSVISEMAKGIDLGQCLLMGKGEEDTGGRNKASILTNAMEAVIGAVYVDGGPEGGAEAAMDLVLRLFGERLDKAIASGEFHDYKTEFQEVVQERLGITPEYRVTAQKGLEHSKVFTVEVLVAGDVSGTGSGRSKKKAEQQAAKKALARFEDTENTQEGRIE